MDDLQRDRLSQLLERAIAAPPLERPRILDEACGADTALRDELASLLEASESSSGYFQRLGERGVLPARSAAANTGADALGIRRVVSHYEIVERIGGGMGVV